LFAVGGWCVARKVGFGGLKGGGKGGVKGAACSTAAVRAPAPQPAPRVKKAPSAERPQHQSTATHPRCGRRSAPGPLGSSRGRRWAREPLGSLWPQPGRTGGRPAAARWPLRRGASSSGGGLPLLFNVEGEFGWRCMCMLQKWRSSKRVEGFEVNVCGSGKGTKCPCWPRMRPAMICALCFLQYGSDGKY
jgi:hypothetical protein